MATNTNKRVAIKWIRDGAKAAYIKLPNCYICGTTQDLELHHTHGLTNLFEKWAREKNYSIETDEDVLAIREEFINTHHKELYEDVFTLCNKHHQQLHKIYGKSPALITASKQGLWVENQKRKLNGMESAQLVSEEQPSTGENSSRSRFSSFY
jgi:5-methylcytosine-specific restriction endonuclease McrA